MTEKKGREGNLNYYQTTGCRVAEDVYVIMMKGRQCGASRSELMEEKERRSREGRTLEEREEIIGKLTIFY